MLQTDLKHIMSDQQYKETLESNENVMVCCGRNGPMCLPVYDVMESLESKYEHVAFRVLPFDHPVSNNIRRLPEVRGFMGLPMTIYYRNGKVVAATSSIQSKAQVVSILNQEFKQAA